MLAKLPFVGPGPFTIDSFWGIVWVHRVRGCSPILSVLLMGTMVSLHTVSSS